MSTAVAARRYAACGRTVYWSVRAKLALDPVYAALAHDLALAGSVVDLGCGRGLALAVALSGRPERAARPTLVGIERSKAALAIARRALGDEASLLEADLAGTAIPPTDIVLLLDVLHYLEPTAQDALLDCARAALAPGGRIVVREADAGAAIGFAAVRFSERLMALARGEVRQRFAYRSAAGWAAALASRGLAVETTPMGSGTPFANVLLLGRNPA
jgi:SAM-dependent methyltransferase